MDNYLIFLTLLLSVKLSEIVKTILIAKMKKRKKHKKRRASRRNHERRK